MKRKILSFILTAFVFHLQAQINVNKPAPVVGFEPSVIGRNIMDQLNPALALTNDQIPKVTILVGQFLTKKAEFVNQMQSDPDGYRQKFTTLQKTFVDGMKKALKPAQFSQFMLLKPAEPDINKPISQLFY
ncbi:MAG TPA: hypothetical protein VG737_09780 [Cyclobacteriaceae bacterium]|nr:hypothetical protein [Cyclobacteriaceae bacterium]